MNTAAVEAAVSYLDVKNVRDSFSAAADVSLFAQVAAATGVKFDIYFNTGQTYTTQIRNMITDLGIMRFAEGVNEADITTWAYDGLTGVLAAVAAQEALYTAITAASSTVDVIGFSYGKLSSFATAPNTSAYSDYGNSHEYWGTGNPPGPGIPSLLADAEEASGSDPIIATEAGYYTGPSASDVAPAGVSELVQAKYDLTVLFDDWVDGVPVTYLYELMDDASDPNNTNYEDHFGIFNADGTPKLAATAVKNLISILGSGDNGTKSGDSFGYQLVGAPASGNSLLLEKSNGDFDIAVWNDIRLWSATSYTAVTNSAVPVTLNFGQLVESVTEYDPLSGSTAVQTWSNVSSISFNLPDHPVIFEVQPYPAVQLSLASYDLSESLSSNQPTANLWSQIIANAVETNPNLTSSLTIKAVSTTGTTGTVSFSAATKSLVYTAPAYNGLNPADSFTYTVSDSAGDTVTGTVAITELPNPNTTYATATGASYTAPSSNWTMVSLATGQSLNGSASGGDTFILDTDTNVYAQGSNNTITGGNGNFYVGAGVNNAHVTLGNGNSTIAVFGTGAVITTGNGNNMVWQPTGSATITMGNGNQRITATGAGNTVSIGSGTSNIALGNGGGTAGNESVTVGGGTNIITVGGTYDTVHILGGTGNIVVSTAGLATITIEGGSNTLTLNGTNNTVALHAGTNTVTVSGASSSVQGGSGADTIRITGNNSIVTAGTGTESITLTGSNSTINLTAGTDSYVETGSSNILVLPPAGGTAAQIHGNVVADGDKFDLTAALSATTWNGSMSTLANYLSVRDTGAVSIISIDPDGTGLAAAHEIAVLNTSANLSYATLVADAVLPSVGGTGAVTVTPSGGSSSGSGTSSSSGSSSGSGSATGLILNMSEDAYQGDAQFTVSVNGHQVGSTYTATASNTAGQSQAISIPTTLGSGTDTVGITFLSDAYGGSVNTDRNLYLDSATVNGVTVSGRGTLLSPGTDTFSFNASNPATVLTSTLALNVSEDTYQGNAEMVVSVGNQVMGYYTVTASHSAGQSQTITIANIPESLQAHDIAVAFVNDAYGGSASLDRNLYLNSMQFDGKAVSGGSATFLSNGTQHFTATAPANWTA